MDTYTYKAKHLLTEKMIHGEIKGESIEAVKKALASQYLYPLNLKRKKQEKREKFFKKEKIKLTELNFFCKQFSAMLEAGISVNEALELGAGQSSNKALKKHLYHIQQEINQGKTFSKAVEQEGIFPRLLVHMIVCGEVTGNLGEMMKRAVNHFEKQLGLQRKVKKAFAYPIFVLAVTMVVVVILMMKVVPSYLSLLKDTGASIPLPTQIVINISRFLTTYWLIIAVSLPISIGGVLYFTSLLSVKKGLEQLMLKVPIMGEIKRKSLSADFSSTLSMLVEAGVPILRAMEVTKNVMGHAVAEIEMNHAIEVLKNGNSLFEAIRTSTIFPPILLSMVRIGEETGSLDEMLRQISCFFKEEVETSVGYMTVFIEPILIMIVALIVGGIMAAIMLPTFSAATSVM